MPPLATATHALIDGVCYPKALKRLYGRSDIEEIVPLYLGTRWKELAEHGPLLVKLGGTGLINEASAGNTDWLYRAMSFFSSQSDTRQISRHLRRFITFKGAANVEQLLRFADPLVTRHWLESYGSALPAHVMGPIDTWWVAHWSPRWSDRRAVTWQAFTLADAPLTPNAFAASAHCQAPDFLPMADAQYAALEAVTQWQLKERLTDHFQQQAAAAWQRLPAEQRGQWLDERLADALAWGANTHRQLAIWVDLSLHWGDDFSTASDGLYQRWRAHEEQALRLSAVEQLYALDRWSRTGAAATSPVHARYSSTSHSSSSVKEAFHG
ncbi:DUF4123 domain-containing protein [Vreelandella sp. GE22]